MTASKRRERLVCLLAFLVPAAVMLWAYASMGMAPWGDKTILASDMADQYVEFFCALKSGDVFFSWSKALGTSYIGVFSYYVSSPLSALTLLVPNESMPVGLLFLTVLKIGLAGAAFALYSQKMFPGSGAASLICAVSWALMSYNAAYSLCIMWLDGVIWLPLILLALERVLAGRGFGPFAAALAVCFLSTWYISYMIGAFCLLYFIARCVMLELTGRELALASGRFIGGAACALGLTAWMWLPTFLAMFNGKFSGGNVDYAGLLTGELVDILGRLFSGSYTSITYAALPYVFCGTAAALLAVLYFYQRHPLREKLAWGGLLCAMAASLLLSPLDKLWHLLQKPNWFPWRYGFAVSFVVIALANMALPPILAAAGKRRPALERWAAAALAVLTVVDLGLNTKDILRGMDGQFRYQSFAAYQADYRANAALTAAAYADSAEVFFRMGAAEDRGHNGPLAFGYPGITHYSSLYNYDVNELTRKLGFAQSWMWCAYYGSTPVTDALMDFRYVISKGGTPYEALARSGEYTLYKNPDVLPVAFLSAGESTPALSAAATPFERQNDLLSDVAGEGAEAFVPIEAEWWDEGGAVRFAFTGTGRPVYADLSGSGLIQVWMEGGETVGLGTSEAASVRYLGTPAEGEECLVTVWHDGSWAPPDDFLWTLDREVLSAAVAAVDTAEVLSVGKDGTARLTVTADGPRTLLTTVPAEEGWTVLVDGERAVPGVWLDTFLAAPLSAGEHAVELRYTPPGLYPGIALGALAAAALIGAALVTRRKKKN